MSGEGNYVLKTNDGRYGYIDEMAGGYPGYTNDFGGAHRWITAEAAASYCSPGNSYGLEVHKIVDVVTKPVTVRHEMVPRDVFEDPR